MENIELVIKIPEERYKCITSMQSYILDLSGESFFIDILKTISIGTPLPKGHGVLKDVTNLMRGLYTDTQTTEETFTSSEVYRMIDEECPTIIEADKKESGD